MLKYATMTTSIQVVLMQAEMAQNWLKLDAGVKQQIKQLLLSTLPTQVQTGFWPILLQHKVTARQL